MAEEKTEPTTFRSAAKISHKIRDLANKLKASETENTALKGQITTLSTKVTTLEGAASNPTKDRARVIELKTQIRNDRHRSAFARLAKAAGAADDLVDDLYERSGYTAEADEPDEEQLEEVLAEVKAKKPSAFVAGKTTSTDSSTPAPKPAKPVAGAGRGSPNPGRDGTIITAEQRADPLFMLNPKNKDVILAAAKEGRFR